MSHANPFAKEFFRILNFERTSMAEVAARSGVSHDTMQKWKSQTTPNLANIEAALNVLGYGLKIIRIDEA